MSESLGPLPPGAWVSEDGKIVDRRGVYYLERRARFAAEAPALAAKWPAPTVFVGDSITEQFDFRKWLPRRRVINRGIGGDKIGGWRYYGVLDRLECSVFRLRPARVYLLIGINDMLYWDTPDAEMRKGYAALLDAIRAGAPDTRLVVQSLLPLTGEWSGAERRVREFNRFLQDLTAEKGVRFWDIHDSFCDMHGFLREEFTNDGLHLTPAGYAHWAGLLESELPEARDWTAEDEEG